MIIAVGATSEIKTEAVDTTVKTLFPAAQVLLLNMGVEAAQLFGFDQLTQGANAKARQALDLQKADVGIGIEKGLVKIETGTEASGWFDVICVASLTADGKTAIGFGAGFFIPDWVVNEIKEKQTKLSDIISRLSAGSDQDAVGYFSNHLLERESELKNTVLGALSKLINEDRYHL